MNRLMGFALILVLMLTFLFNCTSQEGPAPLIPMKDFFKNPTKTSFKLSPNGEYLAFLQPWGNRMNVHVQKIGEEKEIRISSATERDIRSFFWANNERIAYVQDKGGNENYHLFAVDIDGGNLKELTPFENVRVTVVDDLEDDEEFMLIGMNKRNPQIFDVYRINIVSGEMEMIAENPGNVMDWQTDNNGVLRVAVATDGVNSSILYREKEDDSFKTVLTTNFRETLEPLFFTFDNQYIYASSNLGRDKQVIVKYDVANAKEMEVLYQHPDVDVSNLLRSKKRKLITGAMYVTDKRHYHFFDEERKDLQKILQQKLPDYEVVVTSMSKDETKVMVRTFSDKTLGAYYFYNTETGEFKKLVDISPWLNEEHMAEMQPIKYEARDGLTIHGYLTLPKGVAPSALPVVVNPHGGPWARDNWGFNPEVQFLANRGYAVLQMNFRGSTGYGREFWEISFKEWGKSMQDDITDGVNWLIKQGIADSTRIGIYGGSYGGYAVLAGLAFTPDLYACGIDYVGVSNIFTLMQTIPPYWEPIREMFYAMVGDPEKEKELLTAASPLFHADKIKAPLFVAQGANDPRVKKAESDQIVNALKERGVEVQYMVKENEGHGFGNEENRFDFYGEMEKFLGQHLGGKVMQTAE
ncbi:MAG: S9 family peptidase [Calditrichaceae bacterium]|nr:S9 family peptidase [Calditrichaceae bacterium]HES59843.1 S9 family peptidase [Caldithrix sp.]